MTEPSKAAMERAKEIYAGGGSLNVVPAIARELDRVNQVARDIAADLAHHFDLREDAVGVSKLRSLMLPDPVPDAVEELHKIMRGCGVGHGVRDEVIAALTEHFDLIPKEVGRGN